MKRRAFALLLALVVLAPLARGQDDANPEDRPTIFRSDSKQELLLKHIWRRLGGPGDTATGSTGSVPVSVANPTTTTFRNATVSATPVVVKASAGSVYSINFVNPNSSVVYVKYYDSAAPTVGTTVPLATIVIQAGGSVVLPCNGFPLTSFTTAITLAAVTGYQDTNSTAPTIPVIVQLSYQ